VLEYKRLILNPYRCFCGASIICVLQKFRQNVARTLYLLEKLFPGTGKLWISF